jgi:hypothetical protein
VPEPVLSQRVPVPPRGQPEQAPPHWDQPGQLSAQAPVRPELRPTPGPAQQVSLAPETALPERALRVPQARRLSLPEPQARRRWSWAEVSGPRSRYLVAGR